MRALWLLLTFLPCLAACDGVNATERARLLSTPAMRRLAGSWDVSFEADPRSTTLSMHDSPATVTGTLVLATAHHGPTALGDVRGITHEGAYDLDFQPFGWTTRDGNEPAVAVARLQPPPAGVAGSDVEDSVFLELSPGTRRFPVQMQGALEGDSIRGTWSATSFSSGGGSGHFVMRRSPLR